MMEIGYTMTTRRHGDGHDESTMLTRLALDVGNDIQIIFRIIRAITIAIDCSTRMQSPIERTRCMKNSVVMIGMATTMIPTNHVCSLSSCSNPSSRLVRVVTPPALCVAAI